VFSFNDLKQPQFDYSHQSLNISLNNWVFVVTILNALGLCFIGEKGEVLAYRDWNPSGRKEPLPWERRLTSALGAVVIIGSVFTTYAMLRHIWHLTTNFSA